MKQYLIGAVLAATLLAGCDVKDPIYNTPHPEKGAIILSADWTARGEGVNIPAAYTAELNGTTTVLSSNPAPLSGLFSPGVAKLCAWNTPEGFTIADGKATLAPAAGANGLFTSQAGWLFTGSADITVIADDTLRTTLPMHQRMRLLRFELTVTGGDYNRITGIEATLNGIATTVDLHTGTLTDATGTAVVALNRTDDKITGEARLPGIAGTSQEFAVTLSFEGNEPTPQTTRSDISAQLSTFNDGQLTAIVLTGNLRSPVNMELGSTVIDWMSGNGAGGEDGSAGMETNK